MTAETPESLGTDLNATAQTEELFKEYMTEQRIEESSAATPTVELSCKTMLRYLDCVSLANKLMSVAAETGNITLSGLRQIVDEMAASTLGFQTKPDGIQVLHQQLTQGLDPPLTAEPFLGLTALSRGSIEQKIETAFRSLGELSQRDGRTNRAGLQAYLRSVFRLIARSGANVCQNADIKIEELSDLTAQQCFDDNRLAYDDFITPKAFIRWFAAQPMALAPTKATLQESRCQLSTHHIDGSNPGESCALQSECVPSYTSGYYPASYPAIGTQQPPTRFQYCPPINDGCWTSVNSRPGRPQQPPLGYYCGPPYGYTNDREYDGYEPPVASPYRMTNDSQTPWHTRQSVSHLSTHLLTSPSPSPAKPPLTSTLGAGLSFVPRNFNATKYATSTRTYL